MRHADDTQDPPHPLTIAWQRHISDDLSLFERLLTRHRERQRRYHRIEHVEAVVAHVVELADAETPDDLDAVVAAAFYHDAIYEPTHPANERASARLARRDLTAMGWSATRCDSVAAMIEGTATHLGPGDVDTAVLFDADLAILGSEPDRYAEYVRLVRDEYSHLSDSEWRDGRSDVLDTFLERDPLYATEAGRHRWGTAARVNLSAELADLRT